MYNKQQLFPLINKFFSKKVSVERLNHYSNKNVKIWHAVIKHRLCCSKPDIFVRIALTTEKMTAQIWQISQRILLSSSRIDRNALHALSKSNVIW